MRFSGLEAVELPFGDVLYETGSRMRHVYFPVDAVVSLLATRGQGASPVEVGVIGSEGVLGVPIALGVDVSGVRAAVQGAGMAMRATTAQFREHITRNAGLRRGVYRYSHELTAQIVQIAACNRNHSVEQRLARWLLMMRERTGQDRIELTQQFLGAMLGVRRAGVNEAVGILQERRLVRLRRGSIEILDRAGVERAACACYEAVRLTSRP